ncbi:MAG: putative toxin-antitoxin system toxin component, PIN family [Pyrinomonadaceae bacterium]
MADLFSGTGVGAKCRELVTTGQVELIVSPYVLEKIRDVLTRPETRERFAQATEEKVAVFIEEIIDFATFIPSVPKNFEFSRDPKDEPYINLAAQEEADYIVSRDKDLLDLMTGYDIESKEFRQKFRPLKIVDTLTFVEIVESSQL